MGNQFLSPSAKAIQAQHEKIQLENQKGTTPDDRERFSTWLESMDGQGRMAKMLGKDPRTLGRYKTGELPVPKWLMIMVKVSEELAAAVSKNNNLMRESRTDKDLIKVLRLELQKANKNVYITDNPELLGSK